MSGGDCVIDHRPQTYRISPDLQRLASRKKLQIGTKGACGAPGFGIRNKITIPPCRASPADMVRGPPCMVNLRQFIPLLMPGGGREEKKHIGAVTEGQGTSRKTVGLHVVKTTPGTKTPACSERRIRREAFDLYPSVVGHRSSSAWRGPCYSIKNTHVRPNNLHYYGSSTID